jgi:hypothetical protein
MQKGGRPHGNPLLMPIETNGSRTGKFGVIFLLFTEDAQAAWDSPEHLYNHHETWNMKRGNRKLKVSSQNRPVLIFKWIRP